METIKVKVWCKKEKRWLTDGDTSGEVHPKLNFPHIWTFELTSEANNKLFEFCLFTGKLDKNKNEIYNKDIIKFRTILLNGSGLTEEEKIGVVIYCDNSAQFLIFMSNCECEELASCPSGGIEIIGNECQNPELLK